MPLFWAASSRRTFKRHILLPSWHRPHHDGMDWDPQSLICYKDKPRTIPVWSPNKGMPWQYGIISKLLLHSEWKIQGNNTMSFKFLFFYDLGMHSYFVQFNGINFARIIRQWVGIIIALYPWQNRQLLLCLKYGLRWWYQSIFYQSTLLLFTGEPLVTGRASEHHKLPLFGVW